MACAEELIYVAKKLWHPILFRECFVHIVGHWAVDDQYMTGFDTIERDPILCGLVTKAIQPIVCYPLGCQPDHFALSVRYHSVIKNGAPMDLDKDKLLTRNAKFYRSLKVEDANHHHEDWEQLGTALSRSPASNLVLDQTVFGAGDDEGLCNGSFLCAEIPDEDLPWDPSEIDW